MSGHAGQPTTQDLILLLERCINPTLLENLTSAPQNT